MPALPKQFQVRWTDGCIYTIMAHSNRGAARRFVMERQVERGDEFRVKERLGEKTWIVYVKTKNGIRELGVIE